MRMLIITFWLFLAGSAHADPRAPQCSTGKWGHVHCIRNEHFVYDTCNAIELFSKRHGLDSGFFARLIWQESRFDPNALSHANARGIAQFIPSTARLRGLKDPYNPADALEHSAQYLAEMARRYGNEGMAAIGYNGGERRAEGFLAGKGLASETINYVPIITGLTAEQWRDAPPKNHDFRLAKDKPFYAACSEMARKRKLSPLKRAKPPVPPLKPWGVQLGFGTSKKSARAKVQTLTRSCRAQVKREKLDLVFVKNRVSGKKGYYFGRIGRNTREGAQKLCNSLKRQGCRCLTVNNKK
ncbi:lytic transglycosylase domain-containing protein [Sulfitobacter donghicola]|uniref:Transglycosylase n=1 Tax=Sulfitobacter donghicola DSW-25 = KCTC 12864 = JCM 14565 TaxID=1300350 RepID=A0A073IKL5_9RHOB|nr:lytic transglycosylase domain-containing protein [Sulfitobacter donghicola]KEJ90016.1 transglycosylase [Sulfitobacter donghicola DSW-25 = KCTC 12864 = JCM 14565]KIN66854.1 putative transglycosylase transmembrane protein [Sulfitobacter donghicola DSW-25 = KCTC 12864 = JCM 14565]